MHGLVLACERLMSITRKKDMTSNEFQSAMEAYVELRDGVREQQEDLEKIQLMLKVVGHNLMGDTFDEVPSS